MPMAYQEGLAVFRVKLVEIETHLAIIEAWMERMGKSTKRSKPSDNAPETRSTTKEERPIAQPPNHYQLWYGGTIPCMPYWW